MNNLEELKLQTAKEQKLGLHFMLASVPIWIVICTIQFLDISILTKNMMVFCLSVPLMPLAYLISKPLGIVFSNKDNPLNKLGVLFSANQMLYILIPMWAYGQASKQFLMIYAIIFGAHLLPFSWLYECKLYLFSSIFVSISCLILGCLFGAKAVAVFMMIHQMFFCVGLIISIKGRRLKKSEIFCKRNTNFYNYYSLCVYGNYGACIFASRS